MKEKSIWERVEALKLHMGH